MDFALTDRCVEFQQRLTAFMDERVYPAEAVYEEQLRESGMDPTKMRLPPEQWFPADDGLKTVRALAEYLTANLNDFKQPNPILRDLKAAEALLAAADAAGVRFHFTKASL